MPARRTPETLSFAAAIVVLVALSVGLQVARDRRHGERPVDEQNLYLRSGELMKRIALSYDSILADVYWIRAIQHYGGDRLSDKPQRYQLLYPLLDLTTSLDPRFSIAYRFGAIFLAEPYPGGAGQPHQAIALLEKGVRAAPDKWQYMHDIGFVYYLQLRDYRAASEWFQRASEAPGGPWWLRTQAAVMLTTGGDRESSRFMWRQILEDAGNDFLRRTAERRLAQIDALDQIDALRQIVDRYQRLTGELPESWEAVVSAGLLRGIPVDPAGTRYQLNRRTGEVTVSGWSPLHPLPVEPARPAT